MKRLKFIYSIKGRVNEATTTKDGDLNFYLNQINTNLYDPDKNLRKFIAYLSAVELHEMGHFFNWSASCNHGSQKKKGLTECPWCEETYKIYRWLYYG